MILNAIQNTDYGITNSFSFKATPSLKFSNADFYIRLKGYGKNKLWANAVRDTADLSVSLLKRGTALENVLKLIAEGVRKANLFTIDIEKREHSGILRQKTEGWRSGSNWSGFGLITKYSSGRYSEYETRLDAVRLHPLKNPYKQISLTKPYQNKKQEKFLSHGNTLNVMPAIELIKEIFDTKLKGEFTSKERNLDNINSAIAEIRWIIAHATPWERGSDAISNILMRAIYKGLGIKSYPIKPKVSLDLEAYCTELEDYKRKFTSYFDKPPVIPK